MLFRYGIHYVTGHSNIKVCIAQQYLVHVARHVRRINDHNDKIQTAIFPSELTTGNETNIPVRNRFQLHLFYTVAFFYISFSQRWSSPRQSNVSQMLRASSFYGLYMRRNPPGTIQLGTIVFLEISQQPLEPQQP